jgi:hypothetical protein
MAGERALPPSVPRQRLCAADAATSNPARHPIARHHGHDGHRATPTLTFASSPQPFDRGAVRWLSSVRIPAILTIRTARRRAVDYLPVPCAITSISQLAVEYC